jgi:hypothetical protein
MIPAEAIISVSEFTASVITAIEFEIIPTIPLKMNRRTLINIEKPAALFKICI